MKILNILREFLINFIKKCMVKLSKDAYEYNIALVVVIMSFVFMVGITYLIFKLPLIVSVCMSLIIVLEYVLLYRELTKLKRQ